MPQRWSGGSSVVRLMRFSGHKVERQEVYLANENTVLWPRTRSTTSTDNSSALVSCRVVRCRVVRII